MNPQIARLAHGEIPGPIRVGRVRSGVTKLIFASSSSVWLSFDTLRKQLAHHPELTLDFYDDLEWLLLDGEVILDRRERCLSIVKAVDDQPKARLFKATIKCVRSNGFMMLLSVHKIRHGDYKRLLKRT
jgi:hypothetical protein